MGCLPYFSCSGWSHKVTTPKMDNSSNSTPIFEGKMNREDTKNEAYGKDKCKVNF